MKLENPQSDAYQSSFMQFKSPRELQLTGFLFAES